MTMNQWPSCAQTLITMFGLRSLAGRVPSLFALRQPLRKMSSNAPSYSERMDKTGRPISPHVFIYRFPTIALSSIAVRISGIFLTIGTRAAGLGSHPRATSSIHRPLSFPVHPRVFHPFRPLFFHASAAQGQLALLAQH